jgi:hypothetical protein
MYYARVPVDLLDFNAILPELKDADAQTIFVRDTFAWAVNLQYPPKGEYQRRVLKTMVLQVREHPECTMNYCIPL